MRPSNGGLNLPPPRFASEASPPPLAAPSAHAARQRSPANGRVDWGKPRLALLHPTTRTANALILSLSMNRAGRTATSPAIVRRGEGAISAPHSVQITAP